MHVLKRVVKLSCYLYAAELISFNKSTLAEALTLCSSSYFKSIRINILL